MHSFAVYQVWYRQQVKSSQTKQQNRSMGCAGGAHKFLWVGIGCFMVNQLAKDGGCGRCLIQRLKIFISPLSTSLLSSLTSLLSSLATPQARPMRGQVGDLSLVKRAIRFSLRTTLKSAPPWYLNFEAQQQRQALDQWPRYSRASFQMPSTAILCEELVSKYFLSVLQYKTCKSVGKMVFIACKLM